MLKYGQKFLKSLNKGYIGKTFNPSPLSLFQQEQKGKLASFMADKVAKSPSDHFKNYFAGRSLVLDSAENVGWGAINEGLGSARKLGWGAAAGVAGASMMGIDPFGITSGAKGAASLGIQGSIGMGLYRMGGMSKLAGIGYLGATAINTFRRGDNWGPM